MDPELLIAGGLAVAVSALGGVGSLVVVLLKRSIDKETDHNEGGTFKGLLQRIAQSSERQTQILEDMQQEARNEQHERRTEHLDLREQMMEMRNDE